MSFLFLNKMIKFLGFAVCFLNVVVSVAVAIILFNRYHNLIMSIVYIAIISCGTITMYYVNNSGVFKKLTDNILFWFIQFGGLILSYKMIF